MYVFFHQLAIVLCIIFFYARHTIFIHTVDFEDSQDATPAAAIGGGVGGAVFLILLIIALCIVLRLVINSRKKRKVKYLNPAVLTEKDTKIEERTGKLLSYM